MGRKSVRPSVRCLANLKMGDKYQPNCNILSDSRYSQEDTILTPHGNVHVAIQGAVGKPAIITYHDIGLNRKYKSIFFRQA